MLDSDTRHPPERAQPVPLGSARRSVGRHPVRGEVSRVSMHKQRAMSVGPLGLPPFVANSSYFGSSRCCSTRSGGGGVDDQPKLLCFRSISSAIRFIRWVELVECVLQLFVVLLVYWMLFEREGLSTNSYVLAALWIFYVMGGSAIGVTRLEQAAKLRNADLFSAYIAYKRTGVILYSSCKYVRVRYCTATEAFSVAVLSLSFMSKQRESTSFPGEAAVILACSAIILQLSVLTLVYVQRCKSYFRATEQSCYQAAVDASRNCPPLPPSYEEVQGQPPSYDQAVRQSACFM